MYTFIFSCLLVMRNRYQFSCQIMRKNSHIAFFTMDFEGEQQEFVCEWRRFDDGQPTPINTQKP
ncbi:hypothetical protein GGD38_000990 [Chitinophagaceae bacterium OAS944]|nr:hypothetical protein [Chitinophagaceae bacterium OAS944]